SLLAHFSPDLSRRSRFTAPVPSICTPLLFSFFFFFNDTAPTEIYTLSLHDALPISVNAANQVVSVGADIAFDADPKFFACLVRFESSSVPTTLPTAYDVYPLDGRHDGGYYTVKDCVTIDVLPR